MSPTPDTIFLISTHAKQELVRIDDDGNFFVRGEEVASTSIIRDAFLDYAKLYVQDNLATKTLIAIKSMVPTINLQFATEESRNTADYAFALLRAQTQPQLSSLHV